MTNAQRAEELQSQINHIIANDHPDRADDAGLAWANVCALEAEMVACRKEGSVTYERAAKLLADHGNEHRPSAKPGHIQGLVHWIHIDGTSGSTWEDIEMRTSAIRNWLGY